jgi:hypothetical protein
MRFHPSILGATLLVAMVGLGGCSARRALGPTLAEAPAGQARCTGAASQSSPIITEWPASEKARLEALLGQRGVAVAYSGCTLRVLPQCPVSGGGYMWQRTTPASDYLEISDEQELYAKLPLGAAQLEGELKRSGRLSVHTVVAGMLRLAEAEVVQVPWQAECAQATHVVEALSVGAFTLSAGGGGSVGAGVGLTAVGSVGGRVGGGDRVVRAAGDSRMCWEGTDEAPHPHCRSPLQVFLRPLPGRVAEQEEGPPGTVRVDFISAHAQGRWDVYIDDEVACSTPCSRWVNPSRPIFLQSRRGPFPYSAREEIQVPDLGRYAAAGPLQLRAHPTSTGAQVTGITVSALGGMAMMTGLTLSAVSCPTGREELCRGSLLTLGAGTLVTAGAVWLLLEAAPRARILPVFGTTTVGPGFVRGSF